jgi:hypothetical protein
MSIVETSGRTPVFHVAVRHRSGVRKANPRMQRTRTDGAGLSSLDRPDHLDRRMLEQPGEAYITTPRSQGRLP